MGNTRDRCSEMDRSMPTTTTTRLMKPMGIMIQPPETIREKKFKPSSSWTLVTGAAGWADGFAAVAASGTARPTRLQNRRSRGVGRRFLSHHHARARRRRLEHDEAKPDHERTGPRDTMGQATIRHG